MAPTSAAALSSAFWSGISPAAMPWRSSAAMCAAVLASVDQALGVDHRIDRLVHERPRQPAVVQRAPRVRRDDRLEALDAAPRADAASSIAPSSRLAASRNTSTNSSALDGKWR